MHADIKQPVDSQFQNCHGGAWMFQKREENSGQGSARGGDDNLTTFIASHMACHVIEGWMTSN
eukprot:scaffold248617_cov20-Prasinocladus_malaysianus.AAC.1